MNAEKEEAEPFEQSAPISFVGGAQSTLRGRQNEPLSKTKVLVFKFLGEVTNDEWNRVLLF